VKRNQDNCIELIEKIPKILYGIVDLHLTSEAKGVLSPAVLDNVGNFNRCVLTGLGSCLQLSQDLQHTWQNTCICWGTARQEQDKAFFPSSWAGSIVEGLPSWTTACYWYLQGEDFVACMKLIWMPSQIESRIFNFNSINEMRRQSEIRQTEIMELISTFSEYTISDSSSSVLYKQFILEPPINLI
jgi:hypothetical protein